MKRVQVQLERDHLERMTSGRTPVAALTELTWNALDADATRVELVIEENELGGLERIRVLDDGHGIAYEDAIQTFGKLGGSWKKPGQRTKNGRFLHGRAGEGRFSGFALGDRVIWRSCWLKENVPHEFEISGEASELGVFNITDPVPSKKRKPGTEVVVSQIEKPYGSPRSERAIQQFTEAFALYLRDYPDVHIGYDGNKVDPSLIEELVSDYKVPTVELRDGRAVDAALTIIEWKIPVERALILCDAGGFALNRRPAGIQAPGFDFTVYLKSDFLRELEKKKLLDLEDLEPDLAKVVNAAKTTMREHFRLRQEANAAKVVETWKEQKIYPFEGPPKNVLEE